MNVRTAIIPALMLLTLVGGVAIGWYLQKPTPQSREISQEEMNTWLQQNYTIHRTAEGWRLMKKQGEN